MPTLILALQGRCHKDDVSQLPKLPGDLYSSRQAFLDISREAAETLVNAINGTFSACRTEGNVETNQGNGAELRELHS
jgi:hypothetical protein